MNILPANLSGLDFPVSLQDLRPVGCVAIDHGCPSPVDDVERFRGTAAKFPLGGSSVSVNRGPTHLQGTVEISDFIATATPSKPNGDGRSTG